MRLSEIEGDHGMLIIQYLSEHSLHIVNICCPIFIVLIGLSNFGNQFHLVYEEYALYTVLAHCKLACTAIILLAAAIVFFLYWCQTSTTN